MDKRVLIIINPHSGTMKANKYMTDIVELFVKNGFLPTVLTTTKRGDATEYVVKYGSEQDLIVCIGGDGTFNEVASGIIESGVDIPVGYIPAGSTNDFANTLGLSKDVMTSASDILKGSLTKSIDLGEFNGRVFCYVASFGAFTKASYATPQNIKNALGHLAYVLGGIKELASIEKIHLRIEADGEVYEGDYLFGAISNSTSIAGIVSLSEDHVDLNDGLFEMILVKAPSNLIELNELAAELVSAIALQNYHNCKSIEFVNAKKFDIYTDGNLSWTLDGEYQEGSEKIHIENLESAIKVRMIENGARV